MHRKKEQKYSVKLLGLHTDDTLRWDVHIEYLCSKLSKAIYNIRKIRQITDTNTAKIVYRSLFRSNLQYGILIWGNSVHASRVFITQKRAIRAMVKACPTTPCRPLFRELGILTVPSLFILECVRSLLERRSQLRTNSDVHKPRIIHI